MACSIRRPPPAGALTGRTRRSRDGRTVDNDDVGDRQRGPRTNRSSRPSSPPSNHLRRIASAAPQRPGPKPRASSPAPWVGRNSGIPVPVLVDPENRLDVGGKTQLRAYRPMMAPYESVESSALQAQTACGATAHQGSLLSHIRPHQAKRRQAAVVCHGG